MKSIPVLAVLAYALTGGPGGATAWIVDGSWRLPPDSGKGTTARPFLSIGAAAAFLRPGDTCLIRPGIYRETLAPAVSGVAGAPIVFAAQARGTVALSGADPARGKWVAAGAGLHFLRLPARPKGDRIYQVFRDGLPLPENTWPKWEAKFSVSQFYSVREAQKVIASRWCLADSAIPLIARESYWRGAALWGLFGVKTSAHLLALDEHRKRRICFDLFSDRPDYFPSQPDGKTSYAVLIKRPSDLSLLEPDQWAYDSAQARLYLRCVRGDSPERHRIEYRTRLLGLDLRRDAPLGHIRVEGLDFTAAALDFGAAESSWVTGARIRFAVPFLPGMPPAGRILRGMNMADAGWSGVRLSGRGNALRNSRLDGSWADGVAVSGSGNTVENCLIANTNWLAGDFGGISVWGNLHTLTRNTIRSTGRSGIVHVSASACRITRNRIEDYGKLTDDFGGTYTVETDGGGTEIADNRIGPAADQAGKYPSQPADMRAKMIGIYLDDVDADFHIHGNLVSVGQSGYSMRLNGRQSKLRIHGNTLLDQWGAIASDNCGPQGMQAVALTGNLLRGGFEPSDSGCGLAWTRGIAAEKNSFQDSGASAWMEPGKAGADSAGE